MALDLNNLDWRQFNQNGMKMIAYTTADDNKAAVTGSGYFNDAAPNIATGDLLYAYCTDGAVLNQLVNTAGVITSVDVSITT